MRKKLMIHDFNQMKQEGRKITWLTSYDFPTAQFAEAAGLDMLLVGDSLGMCVYGYPGTVPVTMDQCIVHCDAVRRGAPNTFVIGDMPFLSYQVSPEEARAVKSWLDLRGMKFATGPAATIAMRCSTGLRLKA